MYFNFNLLWGLGIITNQPVVYGSGLEDQTIVHRYIPKYNINVMITNPMCAVIEQVQTV